MNSARGLYRLSVGLGAVGLIVAVGGAITVLRGVQLAPSEVDRVAATCRRFLLPDPSLASILVLALGILGVAVIARSAGSLARQLLCQRRFLRMLAWQPAVIGATRIRLVGDPTPQAFCAGYLRPRIYVSLGALKRLSATELEAVISHERHHQRRRDPLRLLVVEVLAHGLFFLPALRPFAARYGELAELAADEAAVRPPAQSAALASALLAFAEVDSPAAAVGIAPERIDHLLGSRPCWELPASLIAGSLVALAALLVAVLGAASGAAGSTPSLPVLAQEVCMLVMVIAPVVCALAAASFTWRRVARFHG